MTSTTLPYGLDRPVVPPTRRPLPRAAMPLAPDLAVDDQQRVRPSHVAAWCLGGSIGWAALIATGWLAAEVLGQLVR